MPAISASAPGKIILFGEHAVVYSRPAIAIPLMQLKATAYFLADPTAPLGNIKLTAADIGMQTNLNDLAEDHPFRVLFQLVQKHFQLDHFPAMSVKIRSEIPIAAGLGSGTAVSVALIRGLSLFLGVKLSAAQISALAFEVEKIYHRTPSGVDNTVITYEKPVFFMKDHLPEPIYVGNDCVFLIADTGIKSMTSSVVGEVRINWENNRKHYESNFDSIASITQDAKEMLISGDEKQVGELMNKNHHLLVQMGVSCDQLDHLVTSALRAGALGAKLSGAGKGGNIIALVQESSARDVRLALENAGATRVIQITLNKTESTKTAKKVIS